MKSGGASDTQTNRIKKTLFARISNGEYPAPGRIPSENEICREFGVSRTTARQAVVRLAEEGLLVRIAGSGTYVRSDNPAREVARPVLGTIGFIRCRHSNSPHSMESDYIYGEILHGIQEVTDAQERHLLFNYLTETDANREKKLDALMRKVDGLIVAEVRTQEFYEVLRARRLPVVLVNPNIYSYACDAVDTDNTRGVFIGMEYLYDLGHRRIAFIRGRMPTRHAVERLQAYVQALQSVGLSYDESFVAGGANWQKETGFEAMRQILTEHPDVTAVFASSDPLALGAMQAAAQDARKVPGDLSVIGFDDMIIARHATPPLTTIRIPMHEAGRCAATSLLDLIADPDGHACKKILFTPQLVIRSSCERQDTQ